MSSDRFRHPPSLRFGVTKGYGVANELINSENLSEFARRYANPVVQVRRLSFLFEERIKVKSRRL